MAGIEALTPPMTSDPTARMWTQIRALQQRVATLESRRDLVVRETITGNINHIASPDLPGYTSKYAGGEFESAGRDLLIVFGPNVAWMTGSISASIYFLVDDQFVITTNTAHVSDGTARIEPCPSTGGYVRLPASLGRHSWRVAAPVGTSFTSLDFTALIMELPA